MKKSRIYLLALLFVFIAGKINAQYANIWYFGDHAGYDFSTLTPITGSAMSTNEGCATICDNTGSLLFYTDGIWIWDNTHSIINSSTPLKGHPSSTQSAIIIPKPGSTNYFIFTQDAQGLGACTVGMHYSEVNVTGTTVTLVTANTFLYGCSSTTEKVTAACHSNGTDYWAVTVLQNGDFVSWPITSAGVGSAVVSSSMATPTMTSGGFIEDDRVGYMKISRQSDRLVLGRRHPTGSVNETFDFNNTTGMVTTNRGTYFTGTVYGVEFSSNGNYFYVTQYFNTVVQYDWATVTPNTIHTSAPAANHVEDVGALQLGPDGNIYVANGYEGYNSPYLDMITNINSATPTYNDNYVTLPAGTYSRLGLPDVVACFVPTEGCKVDAMFNYAFDPDRCAYDFTDMTTTGVGTTIIGWEWTFGDGYSSTLQNPTHRYSTPGVYAVCLTVYAIKDGKCCSSKFCAQIQVPFVCDRPCDIKPEFNWSIDACEPCEYHFTGFTLFANTDIIGWMWDFGDGTTGTGENIDHVFPGPGVYNVCLTVIGRPGPNGQCCIFKICHPVQVDCKPVNPNPNPNPNSKTAPAQGNITAPNKNDAMLKAYPNPASNSLHVEFNAPATGKIKFQLFDYSGKLAWEGIEMNATKGRMSKNIDIAPFSSGLYLLVIEGENLKITEKIQVIKD